MRMPHTLDKQTLQVCLTSSRPVARFAACRALNQLAQHRSDLVTKCNSDLEPLLTDPNRSTATPALTALLKTGTESNVEGLVKQIGGFMADIPDIYKIEVYIYSRWCLVLSVTVVV